MLARKELRAIERQLAEAEPPLMHHPLGDVVRSCRKLCIAYAALVVERDEAVALAAMRGELNRRYARMNEGLIARNYDLTDAMERYEKARRARAS